MAAAVNQVLLGFCDIAVGGKNTSSYLANKIGGLPDGVPSISLQSPRCMTCGTVATHVVQVYCPLEASPYHRTINVFACPQPQCNGTSESWTVLRSQCLESELKAAADAQKPGQLQTKGVTMAAREWCDNADDWGVEEEEEEEEGGARTGSTYNLAACQSNCVPKMDINEKMQDLSVCEAQGSSSPELVLCGSSPVFSPYYISVLEEGALDQQADVKDAQRLLQEYQAREGEVVVQFDRSKGEVEEYEKGEARHGDKMFSKFMKRISCCPEQILRYSWNGSPLFISEPTSEIMVPPCDWCGGPRIFEFQLMPALVSVLSRECCGCSEVQLEFGTVLVYTCRSSCWRAAVNTPAEEFVFVQKDPDHQLFASPCQSCK